MADLFDMKVGGLGFHLTAHMIALIALFVACFAITGYISFRDNSVPQTAIDGEDILYDTLSVTAKALTVSDIGASPGWSPMLTSITRKTGAGTIVTTLVIDLGAGASSGDTPGDILGANDAASTLLDVTKGFGNNAQFYLRCDEVPTGGDPDINLVSGSTSGELENLGVTGEAVMVNNGDYTAVGQRAVTFPAAIANETTTPYVYLTTGDGTDAAYTAGKFTLVVTGTA